MIRLSNKTDEKRDNYDFIFVILYQLIKMVYYKLVKTIMNASKLVEVIIDLIIRHNIFPDLIIINENSVFTSKFLLLLCYFLGIKGKLFTRFYLQIDGQTKRQNNTIKLYLQVIFNFNQND